MVCSHSAYLYHEKLKGAGALLLLAYYSLSSSFFFLFKEIVLSRSSSHVNTCVLCLFVSLNEQLHITIQEEKNTSLIQEGETIISYLCPFSLSLEAGYRS